MADIVLESGCVATPEPPAAHPWRDDPPLPGHLALEDAGEHGYLPDEGAPIPCSRRALLRRLRREPWTPGVFVPGHPGPVRPEAVPELLPDYRRALVRAAVRDTVLLGLALCGLAAWALAWWDEYGIRSLPGLGAVLLTAFLVLQLHAVHQARGVQADVFVQARVARRHWKWVRAQPGRFTWTLVAGLGVVAVLTAFVDGLPGAALVKPAVWEGEAWRMLTGPMLHANFTHAWMNLSALYVLGYMVEAHTSRFHLVLAFLGAVLGGSVLSLLLTAAPSVGASGGVMGLVGFLWVLWRRRPVELPDDFGTRIRYIVGATAVLGVIGLEFIDNWAHLGGLLAGAGVGHLLLQDESDTLVDEDLRAILGAVALCILVGSMIGAVAVTWSTPAEPVTVYGTRPGG